MYCLPAPSRIAAAPAVSPALRRTWIRSCKSRRRLPITGSTASSERRWFGLSTEPAYCGTAFANFAQTAVVRCEVGIIAGKNVSALTGFGVGNALQHPVKLAHDLVSVYNPLARSSALRAMRQ